MRRVRKSSNFTTNHTPLDAEARIWSSELRHRLRTSVLWPGRSTVWVRVTSGGSSLLLAGGTLYTSIALDDSAVKS